MLLQVPVKIKLEIHLLQILAGPSGLAEEKTGKMVREKKMKQTIKKNNRKRFNSFERNSNPGCLVVIP